MERELEKLIIAAFNWYEEERKHTDVDNNIAANIFLSSSAIKELKGKILLQNKKV